MIIVYYEDDLVKTPEFSILNLLKHLKYYNKPRLEPDPVCFLQLELHGKLRP